MVYEVLAEAVAKTMQEDNPTVTLDRELWAALPNDLPSDPIERELLARAAQDVLALCTAGTDGPPSPVSAPAA